MNEKAKLATEVSIELVKGWIRPLVVMGMTAVICVMTVQQTIDSISWQFWAIYSGFAGEWIGERAIKRLVEIKNGK